MGEFADFNPDQFGGSIIQDAPAVSSAKPTDFNPDAFGGKVIDSGDQPPMSADFNPDQFGGRIIDSKYKDIATPARAYTNSVREDLLSRWQTTYSKMPDGPERERYGKLLSQAWDAHVDMQRYNDPLLFRAADSGVVTGGVGLMKGGLAGGEMVLSLPGVDQIPGAERAKNSLKNMRENLQAQQNTFENKEKQFDKESAIGATAAGLTRDMSGFLTQLLMAYSIPGAGAKAATLPIAGSVNVGEVALATMLGSEAAANSLANHPDDHTTALLHGVLNGGGALLMGKSGNLVSEYGSKVVPRAVKAVFDKILLTPIMDTLAHAQGAGAEMAANAAADYMIDVSMTQDQFDPKELVRRMEGGYKTGAMMGGAMAAGGKLAKVIAGKSKLTELADTLQQRQDELPTAAKAIADAREMYQKNEADIEKGISEKFAEGAQLPEGYKEYFNNELDALQNLESDYRDQVKSINLETEQIKTRRETAQAHLDELNRLDDEMRGYVIDETGNRIYKQGERADMMVEGSEGAIKDIQGMRDGLIAELKGLDQREFDVNQKRHAYDRNGKSVKDFITDQFDRLSSEESLITEDAAHQNFSRNLDEAIGLENEIASNGRTVPEAPIPGQEQANVPDKASDVELVDRLGHFTVSGRQRDMNKMRDFFDLDKLSPGESQSVQETLLRAEQRGLIDNADHTAQDALTSDKILNSEEFIGVVERGRQNKSKYVDLMKARADAKTPEEKASIDTQMKGLEDQQNVLTQAAYQNNSDVGRRFNLAKMKLEQAYDPMALLSKADRALASRGDRAKARDLTDTERETLLGHAQDIARTDAIINSGIDPNSKEFREADYQNFQSKVAVDRFIDSLRPRTRLRRAGENVGLGLQDIMKASTLTLDTSILALHGSIPMQVKPSIIPEALASYKRGLLDPTEITAAMRRINNRPNADLYHKYDIALNDPVSGLGRDELIFLSEAAKNLPVVKQLNAANTVALNSIRADLFDAMVDSRGGRDTATHEGLKAIASFVRTASGHGGLGPFESAARALSVPFLSPRWFVSRFQHILASPVNMYRALSSRDYATASLLGKAYAQQYAVTTAAGYIAANVAALAFPGQVQYTSDPTDPNYGLLQIRQTNIDMSAGMRKPIRLITAVGRSFTGADKPMDTVKTVGGLATGALGPYGRLANEVLTRKEMGSGAPIDFSNPEHMAWFMAHGFVPLPIQNFVRGLTQTGMSPQTAIDTAAAFAGVPSWQAKPAKHK